jgi:hypothetical protein
MLDRSLLAAAGEALYGPLWQSQLARALDVSDRTMRRWLAGDTPVPSGVAMDLMRLLTERAADVDEIIERLKEAGAP